MTNPQLRGLHSAKPLTSQTRATPSRFCWWSPPPKLCSPGDPHTQFQSSISHRRPAVGGRALPSLPRLFKVSSGPTNRSPARAPTALLSRMAAFLRRIPSPLPASFLDAPTGDPCHPRPPFSLGPGPLPVTAPPPRPTPSPAFSARAAPGLPGFPHFFRTPKGVRSIPESPRPSGQVVTGHPLLRDPRCSYLPQETTSHTHRSPVSVPYPTS